MNDLQQDCNSTVPGAQADIMHNIKPVSACSCENSSNSAAVSEADEKKDAAAAGNALSDASVNDENESRAVLRDAIKKGNIKLSYDSDFYASRVRTGSAKRISRPFEKGDSKAVYRFTLLNGITYLVWFIGYVYGTAMRYAAFVFAQQQASAWQLPSLTVEVSSQLFTVLKLFAVLLPFVVILWLLIITSRARKGKKITDSRILISVLIIDIMCAAAVAADIISLHMVFV